MDRATVLPPLVHAALDVRDRLPWRPPATTPDGITARTAAVPFCADGVVVRFTATLPDVHASAVAILFTREIDHGDIVGGMPSLFECDLSPLQSGKLTSGPLTSTLPGGGGAEDAAAWQTWLTPDADERRKLEEALFVSGGENADAPDCPVGFPDCHPRHCPIAEHECLTHFTSDVPKRRARDFVIRMSPVVDLSLHLRLDKSGSSCCNAAAINVAPALPDHDHRHQSRRSFAEVESPRTPGGTPSSMVTHQIMCTAMEIGKIETVGVSDVTLAREAASIPVDHTEAYAFAACSCSGAVPAVKCAVRSGMLATVVVSSESSDTIGCEIDMCYMFHVALPQHVAEAQAREHFEVYIAQAQFLTKVSGGKALDLKDPAVLGQAATALRRKKNKQIRAAAVKAVGFGCSCCAVQ